jgi:hypothetical protein
MSAIPEGRAIPAIILDDHGFFPAVLDSPLQLIQLKNEMNKVKIIK